MALLGSFFQILNFVKYRGGTVFKFFIFDEKCAANCRLLKTNVAGIFYEFTS